MSTSITLSAQQHEAIIHDADQKIDMLSLQELESIATRLNDVINIPLIGEEREQVILIKIVKSIDRFIYQNLPNEIYELIRYGEDGISVEEAETIRVRLASIINRHVNIPYLSEQTEQKVFEFVLGIITRALVKNSKL